MLAVWIVSLSLKYGFMCRAVGLCGPGSVVSLVSGWLHVGQRKVYNQTKKTVYTFDMFRRTVWGNMGEFQN